jgi:hypothetical protein
MEELWKYVSECSDYLVCFDMGTESNIESFDGVLHSLAMSADDCLVEYCGWLGDVGNVFAHPKLGKVCLGWECDGCHCGMLSYGPRVG